MSGAFEEAVMRESLVVVVRSGACFHVLIERKDLFPFKFGAHSSLPMGSDMLKTVGGLELQANYQMPTGCGATNTPLVYCAMKKGIRHADCGERTVSGSSPWSVITVHMLLCLFAL